MHGNALKKVNLLPKKIPSVDELHAYELVREELQKKLEEEEKERKDERCIYLVISHARFWLKFNIAQLIKR
eukprot:13323928-Ditylum_brightwellii.AAC.1